MSSIYFDNPLPVDEPSTVRCAAWSKSEETPLLAVAEGTSVRIFREEGEEEKEFRQQRVVPCTAMCWHPGGSLVLVAGWADGMVTFMGPGSNSQREDKEVHREAEILCVAFNPEGTRCVTTDFNGVVGVWKTDHKGMLTQMCHYRKNGAHDQVVFRTMTPSGEPNFENPPFFFGGEQGIIYLADDFGLCSERNKIASPLLKLEYFHQKDQVVAVTRAAILIQFSLDVEGKVVNETKQKLACGPSPEKFQGVWVGHGLLASSSQESIIHFWNLVDDESYIISLHSVDEQNSLSGDKVMSLDFNPRKRVLAAGTRSGKVVQWRCSTLSGTARSENNWQVLGISSTDCAVSKVAYGPGEGLLLKTERSNTIISEAQLNSAVQPPYIAVQTAPAQVLVYHVDKGTRHMVSPGFRVRGLSLGRNFMMVWSQKQIKVYELEEHTSAVSEVSSINREDAPVTSAALVILEVDKQIIDKMLAIASGAKIELLNIQGKGARHITFLEDIDGCPICLDVRGAWLAAVTNKRAIKIWNLAKNPDQKVKQACKFETKDKVPLGEIRSIRINRDGTKLALVVDQRLSSGGGSGGSSSSNNRLVRVPDSRLFIYDAETDSFLTYNTGKSRVPMSAAWDSYDSRLLSCEVMPQALCYSAEEQGASQTSPSSPTAFGLPRKPGKAEELEEPTHCLLTLFVGSSDRDSSDRILMQDSIPCADVEKGGSPRMPVAVIVPHVYFARQQGELGSLSTQNPETVNAEQESGTSISRTTLRDFVGLENVDESTRKALLNFSYHLAGGNTDEAYKSVKSVQSGGVWESLSKMCVKTGRLDIAQKCLGQMGHARAAGAVRACEEPEPEAQLAALAVQLEMIDEAEMLLTKCERWDLLNELYQACGAWDKALEIARKKDRVHLKPTHYAYAQHLEAIEEVQQALAHFEESGTYRTESPRLLCSLGLTDDLESYVERSDDSQLHRWYAQYLESKANLPRASEEYKKAQDWLSLCRVACFNKDLDAAQRICEDTQDQAACYHLARHLEADGRIQEAIHHFQMAGRIAHALRLAQEHNARDLMSLALASDPPNMAQAAKRFEQRGEPSKAVILYQKAGYQKRALELCFSARLFDALRKISDDLNADSDPEVLAKCAEFFMEHQQHDKAVHLLSMSKQYDKAVDLCIEHDVQITEEMAERMTPEKNSMDANHRADILQRMAKLCKKQGSFQLACKKLTQAGDKLKAMKALLQSGDTEKIIFFAGTARQPDIYVLAGNYLQSLDWHNDPDIMKNIIQFYSKAKAHDKLATFYDACAQVEIDEYRDYDKAWEALRESLKYLAKAVGAGAENNPNVQNLQHRIGLVERFASIRKLSKSDPSEMVSVCEQMVDMPDIDSAVRIGDIFAQLVEYYAETQNFAEAYRSVERMRQKGIILTPYVDYALLQTICQAVGQPVPPQDGPGGASGRGGAAPPAGGGEAEDEIEEEDDVDN